MAAQNREQTASSTFWFCISFHSACLSPTQVRTDDGGNIVCLLLSSLAGLLCLSIFILLLLINTSSPSTRRLNGLDTMDGWNVSSSIQEGGYLSEDPFIAMRTMAHEVQQLQIRPCYCPWFQMKPARIKSTFFTCSMGIIDPTKWYN